jgi:hypothetical protein
MMWSGGMKARLVSSVAFALTLLAGIAGGFSAMGKRSSFDRVPRDFYPTPYEAVLPLLAHLPRCTFNEPCAGNGALIRHLQQHGHILHSRNRY